MADPLYDATVYCADWDNVRVIADASSQLRLPCLRSKTHAEVLAVLKEKTGADLDTGAASYTHNETIVWFEPHNMTSTAGLLVRVYVTDCRCEEIETGDYPMNASALWAANKRKDPSYTPETRVILGNIGAHNALGRLGLLETINIFQIAQGKGQLQPPKQKHRHHHADSELVNSLDRIATLLLRTP